MFAECLASCGCVLNDAAVRIDGQIRACKRIAGDNQIINEAEACVDRVASTPGMLKKSELLETWKDATISFAARCLVTLWWGHPSRFYLQRVYSRQNFEILRSPDVEEAFKALSAEENLEKFKLHLERLFVNFRPQGRFHLDGVNVSFFTKFFHFWFAAHTPQSNPEYLPVIADDIMRLAVFAEMMDRGENVEEIFNTRDASLNTYVPFVDKFNALAKEFRISPFEMEDILFNHSKRVGSVYLAAYNNRLHLPDWIAGRYNETENIAIIFNNLMAETYLFENAAASLLGKMLEYDYCEGFDMESLKAEFQCSRFELLCFIRELMDKKIVVDHKFNDTELKAIKQSVNKAKQQFLKSKSGVGNFHASYESVDADYRNRCSAHGIPFSMSFELTYACNEACIHCYNPESPRQGGMETVKIKPQGEMSAQEYFPVLDALKKMGVAKVIFTGGDPFMKKDVMEIMRYAHKLKFALSVYTNGQALYSNQNLYNEVKELYPQYVGLSIYSTVPEIHDKITRRKGSCEKTMALARKFHEDAVGLQIKCPIMQANKDTYGDVYDFARSVNGMPQFDVNITSSIDGDCFASQNLRMTEEQLLEVLKDQRIPLSIENSVGVIDRLPEMCFCGAGDISFNIKPDGTLTPCCAYPQGCGNVKDMPVDELWKKSEELKKVRSLRYGDSDICGKEPFCKYCNRCIGQSYVEHGVAENHSEDNCFLAKIRYKLAENKENASLL